MSLDVYLIGGQIERKCICPCGNEHAIEENNVVFESSITHNLVPMAKAIGTYEALWNPGKIEITKARQLIQPLKEGLSLLKGDAEKFIPLNPINGWGSYASLVSFMEDYLAHCTAFPDALVEADK